MFLFSPYTHEKARTRVRVANDLRGLTLEVDVQGEVRF